MLEQDIYVDVMREAGILLGLTMTERMGGWLLEFRGENDERMDVLEFDVGLNKSIQLKKVKDKSLCHTLLKENDVPSVEHYLFIDPLVCDKTLEEQLFKMKELFNQSNRKIVIKPNNGGAGKDVSLIKNIIRLEKEVLSLFDKRIHIALSPFYDYQVEYRLVVLDGEVLMGFGKKRKEGDFRHNLSVGSEVIEIPVEKMGEMKELVSRAYDVLGIRFASFDIIDHEDGFKILEINSGVTLKRIALVNDMWKEKCISTYRKAMEIVLFES
jgi:ribosomal protein S6--L-glutamate ligase